MKKIYLVLMANILLSTLVAAQSVGINTSIPHASAILDVKSNTKGMLIPRTSTTSRIAIVNPAKGLMLYDTTTSGFWFYNGSAWTQLTGGSSGWSLTGNPATASNFIGTTNNQPLQFRTNNTWAGEIHPTSGNVFFGLAAGQTNAAGQANTAIGDHSLFANTDGNFNTSVGNNALSANTTGFSNSADGAYALSANTTGSSNTAMGRNSLFANTTGTQNTAIGKDALLTNTTGVGNTANGFQALYSNIASNNSAFGAGALYTNTNGSNNVAVGAATLYNNTSGMANTAVGTNALSQNQTGNYNTGNGFESLYFNTTGGYNTATGAYALNFNNTGHDNTANGVLSLWANNSGSFNTASGSLSLYGNTSGDENTAYGYKSLFTNSTGGLNTAIGEFALYVNKTGFSNSAIGAYSLYSNTTGSQNTASGNNSLINNTSGNNNIAIGNDALFDIKTGSLNIAIGEASGTGGPNGPNLDNTIGIGNRGGFLNGQSNQAIIGDASMVFIGGKVPWGVVSDERVKNDITEDVVGLNFIMKLRPVTYHISTDAITTVSGNKKTVDFPGKYDGDKIKYTGFLAQEVEKAAKAVNYDFSGVTAPKTQPGLYTLSYEQFVIPLVKAMQDQQALIEQLQAQINAGKNATLAQPEKQELINEELQKQITEMKKEIEQLKKKD